MESYQPPQGRLTAEQTATLLGITRGNLRLLVRRGHLHHAGGTRYRPQFDVAEVTALHAARTQRSGQPVTQPERHSA
ncbi:helix-turn-helix domain-containing protein [Streptomyces scabiei]|nr:helix-turn-helix domain-containing protein [Streptomyces scabiei]